MGDISAGKQQALAELNRAATTVQSLLLRNDLQDREQLHWAYITLGVVISFLEKDESH